MTPEVEAIRRILRALQPLRWGDFVEEWTFAALVAMAYVAWSAIGARRTTWPNSPSKWASIAVRRERNGRLAVPILIWSLQANFLLFELLDVCGRPKAVALLATLCSIAMRALLVLALLVASFRLLHERGKNLLLERLDAAGFRTAVPLLAVASVSLNYLFLAVILIVLANVQARG